MNKDCHVCELLKQPSEQLLETKSWTVGVGNNQAYFGRAYVTLRTHKPSLSDLSKKEWTEFEEIVHKLEVAYKSAFNAVPLNWGCFMNNAFRNGESNSHVHWHILPRYRIAPVFNGKAYEDPLYGEHYDPQAERMVDNETVHQITEILKSHIDS